jgi:glycosyltransferase involved in cell wall biosynthesis
MARLPTFSVVIPTYMEERTLPNLLKDIKRQSLQPLEVIVADNRSKDRTRQIARKYGARVILGGRVSRARNNGARVAKGEVIVFLDADTRLPDEFFKRALTEMKKRDLGITTAPNKPDRKPVKYFPVYTFLNVFMRLSPFLIPVMVGLCTIVKREAWRRVKGFDESIELCEDSDFTERVARAGYRYRVLRSTLVIASVRRFEERGYFRTLWKVVYTNTRRWFKGTYRNNPTVYEWGYKGK